MENVGYPCLCSFSSENPKLQMKGKTTEHPNQSNVHVGLEPLTWYTAAEIISSTADWATTDLALFF